MRYLTLSGHTWHYARNYPKDVRALLGRYKLQQTLRTSDAKVAAERGEEVNARYEETVRRARAGLTELRETPDWDRTLPKALEGIDLERLEFARGSLAPKPLGPIARTYLRQRGETLTRGGYKSVRYSLELFTSRHGHTDLRRITREDAKTFKLDLARLSLSVGKSNRFYRAPLATLLREAQGRGDPICAVTQNRIRRQVQAFFDWAIYEGHLDENPFRKVRGTPKGHREGYAVPTDAEVRALLSLNDGSTYARVLRLCLLSGLRSGEALGLRREDLVRKGNLGTFVRVRPNDLRGLKTRAAEREVPLHADAEAALDLSGTALFPDLSVNMVTKWFKKTREELGLETPRLVFHSTRKWFITQCERQGVPEHFTASLVGHRSARSGNGITYAIYSGGISDAQKRDIVDRLRLPTC